VDPGALGANGAPFCRPLEDEPHELDLLLGQLRRAAGLLEL